jgi:glycosyltransferase involved in cell wall biosynthesis
VKVVFVSPFPPTRDGIGTYAQTLHEGLLREGHEVSVIATREESRASASVIQTLAIRPLLAGEVVKAIERLNPDVVHVQFAVAAYGERLPALYLLLRWLRRKRHRVVVTMHEVSRDTETLGAVGIWLYREISSQADQIIVHTAHARESLESIAPGREVAVIPHHRVRPPRSSITPEALRREHNLGDGDVVLAFGYIDVDKGLEDVIAAIELLRAEDRDLSLLVAGSVRRRFGALRIFELRDRRYLRRLERRVLEAGLSEHVRFTGYVPSGQVQAMFGLAQVAVLAYRRSEQSGVANLAAALAVPVVTTSVGALPEVSSVPPVPPGEPRALADALRAALSAPRESFLRPERNSIDDVVRRTVAVYRDG